MTLAYNEWTYDSTAKAPSLINLDTKFSKTVTITKEELNPYTPIFDIDLTGISDTDLKDISYESKLYHSDFYQPKFVYDSFNFLFQLESINNSLLMNYSSDNGTPTNNFYFNFITSTTINSRFLFEFPQYMLNYATQDYSNILTIQRNNELALYNSAYANYIRNGYNYDVKNKIAASQQR